MIRRDEWKFVGVVILLVLAVTSLPYLYGYASSPADKEFMGIMLNVPDHAQYFSWMRELTYAHLSVNKLTPEPSAPIFFNLLWWLLGRTGRLLGWNYAAMFQVLRFVATAAFLLLVYRICAWFLEDRLMRQTAFLLAVFASGFGWALIMLKYLLGKLYFPLLVYIVEPNTFLGILSTPHLIGAALYMLAFDLILRGEAKGQLRYAVAAGLFTLFIGWQHAYDLILVYGILGGYGLLRVARDRRPPMYLLQSGLILGVISCWPALYSVLLTSLSPTWKQVLAQYANAGVYTPNPLLLPILMGPAFLLSLFTTFKDNPLRLRGLDNNALFLKAWFWSNFALVYIPTDYQIKMLNGWQVPTAILATDGLFRYVLPWVKMIAEKRRISWNLSALQRRLALALILVTLPTNMYLWAWRFVDLNRHAYPYYLYTDEVQALAWLEANVHPEDVVLASLTIGQYVPALTGAHAFLAHWAQTLDFYGKSRLVEEFFAADTDPARRVSILRDYGVTYVVYGPAEQNLGGFRPDSALFLRRVYGSPKVEVYRVLP